MTHACPLCQQAGAEAFYQDKHRCYFHCLNCDLRFADPASQLASDAEKAVYDQHENNPLDAGYRQFLNRLAQPLLARIGTQQQGLDFGCGPGPTLSVMMQEQGHHVALYDPYYQPEEGVLQQRYDFVTSTEVVEHFCQPQQDWQKLMSCIKPGGWLGIMTKLAHGNDAFASWHYKNDPTHVSFYSQQTMTWIARQYACQVEFFGADVILFQTRE